MGNQLVATTALAIDDGSGAANNVPIGNLFDEPSSIDMTPPLPLQKTPGSAPSMFCEPFSTVPGSAVPSKLVDFDNMVREPSNLVLKSELLSFESLNRDYTNTATIPASTHPVHPGYIASSSKSLSGNVLDWSTNIQTGHEYFVDGLPELHAQDWTTNTQTATHQCLMSDSAEHGQQLF